MRVLVVNVGSTTLKYDVFEGEQAIADGVIELAGTTVELAVDAMVARLGGLADGIAAVGHRVVHGGEHATAPVRIDPAVEALIDACSRFAPLHNPPSLAGIRATRARFAHVPHVAVFDTAFHAAMPPRAYRYALPDDVCAAHGIRRFGFHGPSHQIMAARAAAQLGTDAIRIVTCHLGGGASVAAIDGGVSVDTSMGMTPLEGLVMGTRSGDLDPAIPILLARHGYTPDQLDDLLNHRSGLAGISGLAGDYRAIAAAAERADARARLALDVFAYRLRKYIGGYVAALGGADAIVFAGGIGEHAAGVREAACVPLAYMGVALDLARNRAAEPSTTGVVDVSAADARVRVLVVHADEERAIARDVVRCLSL